MHARTLGHAGASGHGLRDKMHEYHNAYTEVLAGQFSGPRFSKGVYGLPGGELLILPSDSCESRHPYGSNGFNFWAYASGYMHANEGLFSIFRRAAEGEEPSIAFMAALVREGVAEPYSLLGVPRTEEVDGISRYSIFTPEGAAYLSLVDGILAMVKVHVSSDGRVEFTTALANESDEEKTMLLSSYFNPLMRHQLYETSEDRWFKRVDVMPADGNGLPGFLVRVNEDIDRHRSSAHYATVRHAISLEGGAQLVREESTPSRNAVVGGAFRSLSGFHALRRGTFGKPVDVAIFTEASVAANLLELILPPDGVAVLRTAFSLHGSSRREAEQAVASPLCFGEAIRSRADDALVLSATGDDASELDASTFAAFFRCLQKQVEFCSLIRGYVQLSPNSLIGIRDVFQALEALIYWQPEVARGKILEALSYTCTDGRCLRQYSLPNRDGKTGRMDLRQFIDQGVWVVDTLSTWLQVTGDASLLETECGYHRIADEASESVVPAEESGTVMDHLQRIVAFLLRHLDEETGCLRAMYGDWNDALDGLGIRADGKPGFGTGVSVMASLQLYKNLGDLATMMEELGSPETHLTGAELMVQQRRLGENLAAHAVVRRGSESRILHGWGDRRSYLVGSFDDPDGKDRIGLAANAYWVLSGMLEKRPEMREPILKALAELDSKYGYLTFKPAFGENCPGVGRIWKLPPGTAENGASYVHATAFAIMALFQIGESELAWSQIVKVLPFTPGHENHSHSPFVMSNSFGYNPELNIDGQCMNDWQTGSSNVVFKALVRYAFGIAPSLQGLWIQPAAHAPFDFDLSIRLRGTEVRLVHTRHEAAARRFSVNRSARTGSWSAAMGIRRLLIPWAEVASAGTLDISVT